MAKTKPVYSQLVQYLLQESTRGKQTNTTEYMNSNEAITKEHRNDYGPQQSTRQMNNERAAQNST